MSIKKCYYCGKAEHECSELIEHIVLFEKDEWFDKQYICSECGWLLYFLFTKDREIECIAEGGYFTLKTLYYIKDFLENCLTYNCDEYKNNYSESLMYINKAIKCLEKDEKQYVKDIQKFFGNDFILDRKD